jgi:4-hydroxybenzoate polyprenyltransferase
MLGAALAIILLITEHLLVKPTDLSKLNLAFFTLNGIMSVMLATLGIIDIFL